jgi:hypothetical protein
MQVRAEKYTIAATGTTTPLEVKGNSLGVQATGAMIATLAVEGTVDGTNYVSLGLTPSVGGAVVTTFAAAGMWTADVTPYLFVRLNCTAFTSVANPIYLGVGLTGR